ncbi:hypothetical protein [Bermanella sp. R86510]|uniref:hypothetical protein n=1 Tax=unclassified Bermanella TaxID=2627862 RepID=UPI0037C96CEF
MSKKTKTENFEFILEKCRGPISRAGHGVERVAKLIESGVSPRAIAAQIEDNSRSGVHFTEKEVVTIAKVWKSSQSSVLLTKSQTNAFIEDQRKNQLCLDDSLAIS